MTIGGSVSKAPPFFGLITSFIINRFKDDFTAENAEFAEES